MSVLSVCCMTSGKAPERLAAILELLRPVAEEIVVGVDERREDAARSLTIVADRVATFPCREPADRPIAWLFGLCSGDWILNVDDDEVPGERLLAELPALAARDDVTHVWIARRWLYLDGRTYLREPPWSNEFQLRMVLNDERFVQFSDEFHRPLIAHGPTRFVDAPLWHLDAVVNDLDRRRAKVLRYERIRPGMRIDGLAHNSGLYLPELRPDVKLAPVPEADAALVAGVLEARPRPAPPPDEVEHASPAEVDRKWPGEPYEGTLHRARLELLSVDWMIAGVQQTVDVRVTNESSVTWRWGKEAQPELRLAYRWDGGRGDGLRTPLPCDLAPGESTVVPVHVVAPDEPGTHRLEIDVVHEFVRWLGVGFDVPVVVRPRRRVAVAGSREAAERILEQLLERPEVEAVLVEPDEELPEQRFGHPRIPGLRSFLFRGNERVSPALVTRTGRLIAAAARGRAAAGVPEGFVEELKDCEALVVAGPDWNEDAPLTRELWRLTSTVAAARAAGVPVQVIGDGFPRGEGPLDRCLLAVLSRLGAAANGLSESASPTPPPAPARPPAGSARRQSA